MFNLKTVLNQINDTDLQEWLLPLDGAITKALNHGDWPRWRSILEQLPLITPSVINLQSDCIQIGTPNDAPAAEITRLEQLLKKLQPWRKGPYNLFGIHIDTEWHSDFKWRRFVNHILPLKGRTVLDIGCGSGYHAWRMVGAEAKTVIGVEPYLLSTVQFLAVQKYVRNYPLYFLPVGVEALSKNRPLFDTIFSLGLLYHRRSPLDHLLDVKAMLRENGEFVLETLVIEGEKGEVLVPEGRYAKMRNVWFIPTPLTLESWLARCGFTQIRLIDVSKTTIQEQRSTAWMPYESLPDFLDEKNPHLTVEGLPAPTRAVFICRKP
ncbi:MAG TPA: tRNA 5-methoxyuridine(34)/uridine 5-oxyacetic acid(34) synthase CmoB [Caldithrix abyssi]|uniref:tRNA 5-methoxyuridine(34)/uridine 5-oxyacetic acid(34) synthase CmoB n=1 Tax=Caldithrix abyssi TaxID=187145 RepID=A0A7V4WW38_CALAY|nr:tRNA 5-methoxyuridine(34)/uridine 5-oxyacetic acid(34) synthase CmoB [Caldithrix abyssi]